MTADRYRQALETALPVLRRAARHLDVDGDCWFSCATLTCDDSRASDVCDCGAAEAAAALALVEVAIGQAVQGRYEDGYCCDGVDGIGHSPTCPLAMQKEASERG